LADRGGLNGGRRLDRVLRFGGGGGFGLLLCKKIGGVFMLRTGQPLRHCFAGAVLAERPFCGPFFGDLNSDDFAGDRVSASVPNAHAVEDDR
jgi:hypothetical protein